MSNKDPQDAKDYKDEKEALDELPVLLAGPCVLEETGPRPFFVTDVKSYTPQGTTTPRLVLTTYRDEGSLVICCETGE
jgi:hypothetical protein